MKSLGFVELSTDEKKKIVDAEDLSAQIFAIIIQCTIVDLRGTKMPVRLPKERKSHKSERNYTRHAFQNKVQTYVEEDVAWHLYLFECKKAKRNLKQCIDHNDTIHNNTLQTQMQIAVHVKQG